MEGGCRLCGIHWWIEEARYLDGALRVVLGGHGPAGEALAPAVVEEISAFVRDRLEAWRSVVPCPARRGYQARRRRRGAA